MKLRPTTIFSLMLILFTFNFASSQESIISFGPKIGANFSSLDYDDPEASEESMTRLTAGLFLEFGSNRAFSFQVELLYSEQGADLDIDLPALSQEVELNYLQAPLLGKYRFLRIFNIHAGPQFGFLTSDVDSDDLAIENDDLDVSGVAGVGAEIGKLRVDLRYHFGFTESVQIDDSEATNLYYSVTLGYNLF